MGKYVVLKLPIGVAPPSAEYKFVRSIRGMNIYNKEVPEITKNTIDELSDMFGAAQIIDTTSCGIDTIIDALERGCTIRGGSQKKTRRRMTRKCTRRRRIHKRRRITRKYKA